MSHLHERKEKICLNCNAELSGRYCHKCGQENTEPKESFLYLLRHFIEDILHFDGKFFSTLKPLFFKPGFLSQEYILGRRASYINPIRMYLFISAMFFLVLMTFFVKPGGNGEQKKEPSALKKGLSGLADIMDSLDTDTQPIAIVNGKKIYDTDYQTLAQYDSIQNLLPEDKKDGPVERYFARKTMAVIDYSSENPQEMKRRMAERFFHSLPYMLFVTMPLIAFLLLALYWRRKEYYYVSHIIFTLHVYCFLFLLLLLSFFIQRLGAVGNGLAIILRLSAFVYLYLAMLRFYNQGIGKTLVKFILLVTVGVVIIIILTLIVMANTFFSLTV